MHEILCHLPRTAKVLDLGSRQGSFPAAGYPFFSVRVDLKAQGSGDGFVQADAACLPFRSRSFDAVICNHALEHFVDLTKAMQEIGRVAKADGAIFVSVPDARTLQDRLYRKLTFGGGHVNLFASPADLTGRLAWYSGLDHHATRLLYSSFLYLNRRNLTGPLPRRLAALAHQWEAPLVLFNWLVRRIDMQAGTRLSVYGWAMYFGHVPEPVDPQPRPNVCMRCGAAHGSDWLIEVGAVHRKWLLFSAYDCPSCGAENLYSADSALACRI